MVNAPESVDKPLVSIVNICPETLDTSSSGPMPSVGVGVGGARFDSVGAGGAGVGDLGLTSELSTMVQLNRASRETG